MKKLGTYFLLFIFFTNCNKIETINSSENAVYIEEGTASNLIQVTIPAGEDQSSYFLTPRTVYPLSEEVNVELTTSENLLSQYNEIHQTDYVIIPPANYSIEEGSSVLGEGGSGGIPFKITFNQTDTLSRTHKYLLPVSMKTTSGSLKAIGRSETIYFEVDNSVLISTAASITNNYVTPSLSGKDSSILLNGLNEFTMEALINVNKFREGGDVGISTVMGIEGYLLLRFGDAGINNNILQFATFNGNITSSIPASAGKWIHIALTYDGSTAKMYIDGTVAVSQNIALGGISFIPPGRDPFYIGRSWNDNRPLDGAISECRLWSVARTPEDLSGDNKYRVDPFTPGLLAYWRFNEGSGNNIHDYTEHGFEAVANDNLSWESVKLP